MRFQVCPVTKPLGSVSRMTQAGNRVVLDSIDAPEGSYIENKATGERLYLRQENGVYLLDTWGLEDKRRIEEEEGEQESKVTGGSSSSNSQERVEVEVVEEDFEEAKSARPVNTPKTPTPEEYRIHRLTHLPYRSWCPHCVRGKKRNPSHRTTHKEGDNKRGIPVISMDYTFIGNNGDEH
eukprot:4520451-Karenia_brevis.AAC.1